MTRGARDVYLLYGSEDFLRDEFIAELKKSLFARPDEARSNTERFTAGRDPLSKLFDFLRTAPFLSKKRLGILDPIDELSDDEKKSLAEFLPTMPESAALILAAETTPKKSEFLRRLSSFAKTVNCQPPFENEWMGWTLARAKKMGIALSAEAAGLVALFCGNEVPSVVSALENLSLYVHPRKRVERSDVEALLGRDIEADAFGLSDAVAEKDATRAVEIVEKLLSEGARAPEVFGTLASQMERILQVVRLSGEGFKETEIGQKLKTHPFYLKKLLRHSRRFSEDAARRALSTLCAYDEALKKGEMPERTAVERCVLELTRPV